MDKDYLAIYRRELFERCIPFWEQHSIDREFGGYFTCLDRNGTLYNTDKYLWLQGRAVWMFARLHNEVAQDREWLELARQGADFVRKHARNADGRVYFSVDREGRPLHIQRKIFSEVFYIMAMTEMARATANSSYLEEAREVFWQIYDCWQHPEKLGRPVLAGARPASSLAEPMVFLCLLEELTRLESDDRYAGIEEQMTEIALRHYNRERGLVFEHVSPEGELLEGPRGRLLCPGHAIEMGWFLAQLALRKKDDGLIATAAEIIDRSFDTGWDPEYGGLYYFLDAEGRPPLQLEWNMKLWWPATEALYALLLAADLTGEKRFLEKHALQHEWAMDHFSDPGHGEWFGYLDRRGEPTHTLKGGEWKGFFHLPRALLYSIQLLERRAEREPAR